MIVVGGSYTETVLYPSRESVFMGSGLRSAEILGDEVEVLVTVATTDEQQEIYRRVSSRVISRQSRVEFEYLDPALGPRVIGLTALSGDVPLVSYPDHDVLAFGLAEFPHGYDVAAERVVFDPQSPGELHPEVLGRINAEKIAVCANRAEARMLTGCSSPRDAAIALLDLARVETAVVKCGALGYVVAEKSSAHWQHAAPSLTVNSLGSGDVFSSIFAREWFAGETAFDAAHRANTEVSRHVAGDSTSHGNTLPLHPGYAPRVYLAGPFFTLAERWLVERARVVLDALGARVFSPIHDVGPGDIEVAQKDLDGLDSCDVVLALLDGFDPGTVYETGWAARQNIPIVGFSSERHPKETKMLVGMGAEIHDDLTTAMYRAIWAGQGLKLIPGIHSEHHRS
ncbi:PfkB family carbohydrate kinase [Microbacterium sp. LMI1-1-1.1]|uniref:PfkB family carbohydrate kinase n=1 Tax=Microbacterium sp. LMI1-1-1.1 TaxID=3135223 RepID=UPI003467E066